jgi:exonuclease III
MTILYSGGKKHERGVSFILRDKFMSSIVNFKPINDRLCILEIKCKCYNVIMINCYAPTEDKNDDIKNAFLDELKML